MFFNIPFSLKNKSWQSIVVEYIYFREIVQNFKNFTPLNNECLSKKCVSANQSMPNVM